MHNYFSRSLGNLISALPSLHRGSDFLSLNSTPAPAAVAFDYILSAGADTMPARSRWATRIRITVPSERDRCRDTASGKRNNKPSNGVRNCGHSTSDWMQSCCGSSAKQFRPFPSRWILHGIQFPSPLTGPGRLRCSSRMTS